MRSMMCFSERTVSLGRTLTTAESWSREGHLMATAISSDLNNELELTVREILVERERFVEPASE